MSAPRPRATAVLLVLGIIVTLAAFGMVNACAAAPAPRPPAKAPASRTTPVHTPPIVMVIC